MDLTIADVAVHLAASKNRTYRQTVLTMFGALASFLQENSLTTRSLLAAGVLPGPDFVIKQSDLTAEGFELIKRAQQRWAKAIVAGKVPPSDTSILRRELDAMRRK